MIKVNMLKYLLFLFFIVGSVMAQPSAPGWYSHKELEYPDARFLSAIGSGKSEADAKARAASEISLFFKTSANVRSNTITEYNKIISGNGTQRIGGTSVNESISINSEEEFLGIRFAPIWFDKSGNSWYALAYINKEEAREIYQSRIQTNKLIIESLLASASNESEPLHKFKLLQQAAAAGHLIEEDVQDITVIGASSAQFSTLITIAKNAINEYNMLRSQISFEIKITNDRQNRIQRKLSQILEREGMSVSQRRPLYKIIGSISTAEESLPAAPYTVTAGIEFEIQNVSGKSVFSYNTSYSRTSNRVSWDRAYDMAFMKIEKGLDDDFVTVFNAFLSD
jgi:hypothetical protein